MPYPSWLSQDQRVLFNTEGTEIEGLCSSRDSKDHESRSHDSPSTKPQNGIAEARIMGEAREVDPKYREMLDLSLER